MPYFTKTELAMSLCCPALTFLWGFFRLLTDFQWSGDFAEKGLLLLFPLIYLAAVLIGGVLPVVLTLRLKIRTDKHLINRLIVIVIVYGVNSFIRNFGFPGGSDTAFMLYMIVNVTAVLLQILTVKKEDTIPGERAVLILSDPILWWAIYYFAYYMYLLVWF